MDDHGSAVENSSEEETCLSDSFHLDTSAKSGQTLAYVAIFVLSLIGNLLIATVFYRGRNLRTTVGIFILNMACSDFLFALTVAPRRITEILSSPNEWHMKGILGEDPRGNTLSGHLHSPRRLYCSVNRELGCYRSG